MGKTDGLPGSRWISDPVTAGAEVLLKAGIATARLEAGLLLEHVLGLTRAQVLAHLYADLDEAQAAAYYHLIKQRAAHIPLAYLRGFQEFYGISFHVGPGVLIPRPETELLVEFGLEHARQVIKGGKSTPIIADAGTGSGCIAIAVALNSPYSHLLALDISPAALRIAQQNIHALAAANIRLAQCSLLTAVAPHSLDAVLSNPPYIPSQEIEALQPEVREFEPRLALDGGASGLDVHQELVRQARGALRPGGSIAIEVAMGQAQAVAGILAANGFGSIEIRRDLAGIERVVTGIAPEGRT